MLLDRATRARIRQDATNLGFAVEQGMTPPPVKAREIMRKYAHDVDLLLRTLEAREKSERILKEIIASCRECTIDLNVTEGNRCAGVGILGEEVIHCITCAQEISEATDQKNRGECDTCAGFTGMAREDKVHAERT